MSDQLINNTTSANNKRIAKNTIYLYLRMFLTMVVSLYTVRVVLNVLSVTDYGVYGAVGGVIASFGFISSTLACASQRYFAYELGKGENGMVRETFTSIFVLYIVASVIIVVLAEILGIWFLQNKMTIPQGRESAAMWVFQFALASFIISILTNPFQAMIIAKEKMDIYAYVSIIDVLFKLAIVFVLSVVNFDKLKLYAVLLFTTTTISNLIYYFYSHKKFIETRLIKKINRQLVRSIFNYSSWTLFGTVAGVCNTQGLNLILNVFFGPIANAAYSIASQISGYVGNFANGFFTAIRPAMVKSYSSGDYESVNKYNFFSTKVIFTLMSIFVIPLCVDTQSILKLWLKDVSPYMTEFVVLALLYSLLISLSNPITTVVQAQGNVRLYHGLVDGFGLLVLPLTYILFKADFDAVWGYVCMIVIFTICHFLRLYVLRKVFPSFSLTDYLKKIFIPILVVLVLSYFVAKGINSFFIGSVFGLIIHCIISAAIVFLLSLFLVFTKAERIYVVGMVKDRIRVQKSNKERKLKHNSE